MNKLAISLALSAAVLTAAAGHAAAQDSFEAVAKGARRIDGAGLAALFWSQLEDCDKIGNDFARRQCVGLRAARRAQLARETFVVAGGSGALHGGTWDARSKKLPLAIEACVACDGGVAIEGKKRFVTGKGKRQVTGGALRTAGLGEVAIALPSQAEADAWKQESLPRVRSEFVIKLPSALESWKAGELSGYGVEVVAYRVWDPCDGRILAARPRAARVEADRSACPAQKAAPASERPTVKVEAPREPAQPERVSSNEINQALAPVRTAAQRCFETYGVAGKATLEISFDRSGQIVELTQQGDFVDTPTGGCIEKAARAIVFPASKKPRTKVSFPIALE
jgi:hypothetical protein